MKKYILFALVCFCGVGLSAQQALFTAGLPGVEGEPGSKLYNDILQMQWLINGQPLSFGDDTVKITPNGNKLDTVLFRVNDTTAWDTIICNIALPQHYNFIYNPCCGGFNVQNVTENKMPVGHVSFSLSQINQKIYLGLLGETGVLTVGPSMPISPACRSAMSPNIYWIEFKEIELCPDSAGCYNPDNETLCYMMGDTVSYDLFYRTIAPIARFMYMPLDDKTLRVTYDYRNNEVTIK